MNNKSAKILLLLILFVFCLSSCKTRTIHSMEREAREEALQEKYREGISAAQESISGLVEVELWDAEYDIEEQYGVTPEDAVRILENYADGEPVSKKEVTAAIWAISSYYTKSQNILYGIDDYWID